MVDEGEKLTENVEEQQGEGSFGISNIECPAFNDKVKRATTDFTNWRGFFS